MKLCVERVSIAKWACHKLVGAVGPSVLWLACWKSSPLSLGCRQVGVDRTRGLQRVVSKLVVELTN
jgi:hypothetical protein